MIRDPRFRFRQFLLKPLVSRVNRRICIRMVGSWRSTWGVRIRHGSGSPGTGLGSEAATGQCQPEAPPLLGGYDVSVAR